MIKSAKVFVIFLFLTLIIINVYFYNRFQSSGNISREVEYKLRNWIGLVKNRNSSAWLNDLLVDLKYEIMLTRNVKLKMHQWKILNVSRFRESHSDLIDRRALIYCGWVAYHDAEQNALAGGPAGEFDMWADLITALAVVGFELTVVSSIVDFWLLIQYQGSSYDIIITDYGTFRILPLLVNCN